MLGSWTLGSLVVELVRLLLVATASLFVSTLSAVLRVLAMLPAAFVGTVGESSPVGLSPLSWQGFSVLFCVGVGASFPLGGVRDASCS